MTALHNDSLSVWIAVPFLCNVTYLFNSSDPRSMFPTQRSDSGNVWWYQITLQQVIHLNPHYVQACVLIMLLDHFQSILELVLDLAEDVQLSLFCCRFVSVVFRELCLTTFLNKCNITAWNPFGMKMTSGVVSQQRHWTLRNEMRIVFWMRSADASQSSRYTQC